MFVFARLIFCAECDVYHTLSRQCQGPSRHRLFSASARLGPVNHTPNESPMNTAAFADPRVIFSSPLVIGWHSNPFLRHQLSAFVTLDKLDQFIKTGLWILQGLQINSVGDKLIAAPVDVVVEEVLLEWKLAWWPEEGGHPAVVGFSPCSHSLTVGPIFQFSLRGTKSEVHLSVCF